MCVCVCVFWVGFNQYSIKHANGSETQMRKVRSKYQWFTSFCNSHQLSHFTAFFINLGAKTSIAKDRITWVCCCCYQFVFLPLHNSICTAIASHWLTDWLRDKVNDVPYEHTLLLVPSCCLTITPTYLHTTHIYIQDTTKNTQQLCV